MSGPGPVAGGRRVWVLLAHDSRTGLATTVVGVAGVDGREAVVSWMPLTDPAATATWRARLTPPSGPADPTVVLETAAEDANGITADVVEVPAPASVDLRGAVETVVDDLLAARGN